VELQTDVIGPVSRRSMHRSTAALKSLEGVALGHHQVDVPTAWLTVFSQVLERIEPDRRKPDDAQRRQLLVLDVDSESGDTLGDTGNRRDLLHVRANQLAPALAPSSSASSHHQSRWSSSRRELRALLASIWATAVTLVGIRGAGRPADRGATHHDVDRADHGTRPRVAVRPCEPPPARSPAEARGPSGRLARR
jgi:hypothetical protein